MTTLQDVTDIGGRAQYLAVVSTVRPDNSIQSSVVNAGALPHPVDGIDVVGFVTYGKAKLSNLRARPQINITFRSGWQWAAVEGRAELVGPDDHHPDIDQTALRLLLRTVFTAAGGTHDDWDAYDRTMAEQRRTVVLTRPTRLYGN